MEGTATRRSRMGWREKRKTEENGTRRRTRKGCMKGKGGPENALCPYRGVRQRTWGKWVAEIREPVHGARLWLGTFKTSIEAALAYDDVSRRLYGDDAKLNLPDFHAQPVGGSTSPAQVMAITSPTDHHQHTATPAWEVDKTQNEKLAGMNGRGGGGYGGNVEMFWEEMLRSGPAVEDGDRWGYEDSFDMFGSKFCDEEDDHEIMCCSRDSILF